MSHKILTSFLLTLVAIGGFFVSFDKKMENGDISIAYMVETYALTDLQLAASNPALQAADGRFAPVWDSTDMTKMYNGLVAGLNIALSIVTIIVSPAIMLAGWLMSPDWTSGDLFGLRAVMYKLWITVSNITYFIYAILLIFIALATIFGKDNFGYKAMLPKLALGILMVPFTWWFVQWTISLSSIVTASVITIPNEALSAVTQGNTWWNNPSIPTTVTIDENSAIKSTSLSEDTKSCTKATCLSPQDMLGKASWMYGHMLIYAYWVFKLSEVKKIDNVTDGLKSVIKLVHDGFIAVIMLIIFGLLTLALIFMLLARAVMLWIYTIFSPFLTLELVMGWIIKKMSENFSIKEFIWLAFVPAIVWLALSFGLIVVAAVQSPISAQWKTECTDPLLKWAWCTIASLMGNDENKIRRKLVGPVDGKYTTVNEVLIGWITFVFKWKIGWSTDIGAAESVNNTTSIISSTGGIFGTIIVDIIALLFIWMAFMAAKWVNKVVAAAAQPFEDMGKSIGKLGADLPKYTPIPGLGVSAKGMSKLTQDYANSIQWAGEKKAYESGFAKALGVDTKWKTTVDNRVRLQQAHGTGQKVEDTQLKSLQSDVKNMVSVHGTESKEWKEALRMWKEILEKSGKDPFKWKDFLNNSWKITNAWIRSLEWDLNSSVTIMDGIADTKISDQYYKPHTASTVNNNTTNNATNITKLEPIAWSNKDLMGISIQNKTIEITKDTDGKIKSVVWVDALKNLKAWMTKVDFTESLKNSWKMSKEYADRIVTEIEAKAPDFFK